MRQVAITGLGIISPLGNDVPTFWSALCAGVCGIGPDHPLRYDQL